MKNLRVIAPVVISICFFVSCRYHHRYHSNRIDVNVTESQDIYKLSADYNENKSEEVQQYINDQIRPNRLFASPDDYFDANTELKDNTKFYIKYSPGQLMIKLNKHENSYESYTRIKHICEGVAGILKEK